MPFQIVRNDITKVKADAIVNTANPLPTIGSGTDRAVYGAAGKKALLAEREKIGNIAPGEVRATSAFKLKAKYILHTVGPAWEDGTKGERDVLHNCYKNALSLAEKLKCESIAFPLIATGNYGFPKDEALQIALEEIEQFLENHDMTVILVVFDKKAFQLSADLKKDIEEFIDENGVGVIEEAEYAAKPNISAAPTLGSALKMSAMAAPPMAAAPASLDDLLENQEDTFQQRLFKLIDESGMTDVEVYKGANLDRKVFSKIRSNANYKPTKKTALALCIALHLDEETMEDLLARAELALSPSSKFDKVIRYFVEMENYDIYTINLTLFEFANDTLSRANA